MGVEVGEAVVAVPAVLPALRAKAVAVDDFFGQAAAGVVAVAVGSGFDLASFQTLYVFYKPSSIVAR